MIDFGLNTTFATKDPFGIGFEAIIRTHREQRRTAAILKRDHTPSLFLVLSLLLLSGNVEQNFGPHYKYPCGSCTKPVKSNQRGVQCDICDIWYHTRCMLMSPEVYEGLANTSAVSICPSCGVPNFSGTLLNVENNMELSNPFSRLTQTFGYFTVKYLPTQVPLAIQTGQVFRMTYLYQKLIRRKVPDQ